ncbi:uncharacterized protein LOC129944732 [Eupeodes corollae]|uniref:uncharacterized protein LOC129944732 n=1 Tax=Eupeodes corollae TaxID=290404 RepID=UPI00249338A1|nr:uncharacterized protein LOC129944732 [Eupeodes corollae]
MANNNNKKEGRKFIVELIEVYETLPALWNVKCKEYSNRNLKSDQYENMLAKYRERYPDADKAQLIQKLNSLRTNYRKELKKISDSEKSGAVADEVVEPSLWYFDALHFLRTLEQPCSSKSSMNNKANDTNPEMSHNSDEQPPKKAKTKNDGSQELISLVRKRLQEPKNEFEQISAAWAVDLQRMEPEQQLFAKKAINDILFEGRMGTLNRNSVKINMDGYNSASCSTPYSFVMSTPSPADCYYVKQNSEVVYSEEDTNSQNVSKFFSTFQ